MRVQAMLSDYQPELFVLDVETFLRSVCYDRHYSQYRVMLMMKVRDSRKPRRQGPS